MKIMNQPKLVVVFLFNVLLSLSLPAVAALDIQTWQTSKGTKVLFVESKQLPMLDIEMTFDAGSARDGKVFGLANMTSVLMSTATQKRSEDEVAQGFDELGAQIGSGVSRDSSSLSLRTLTRPEIMSQALALFSEVLTQPKFETGIFEPEL